MKNKSFAKKVYRSINENKISLKILLEDKEEDEFDMPDKDSEEAPADSAGGDDVIVGGDEDDGDEDDGGSNEESDDSVDGNDADEEGGEEDLEADKSEISAQNFEQLVDAIKGMTKITADLSKNKGLNPIQNAILQGAIGESVDVVRSITSKGISRFLSEVSQEEAEQLEVSIDNLDDILSKGNDLVNNFKKGKDIDVESYVESAINAYTNFDNLFSKEEIVKQAAINVIILNSGANANAFIDEFEELFHEELNRKFGISYDEHALITKKNNIATGAKSQG